MKERRKLNKGGKIMLLFTLVDHDVFTPAVYCKSGCKCKYQ